jgi:hypothetical protein
MARPKNLAALTGRPSTFNTAQACAVLERVSNGEALTVIGKEPDMPASTTVLSWAETRPWFKAALQQAQRMQARHLHEEQLPIADSTAGAKSVAEIYSAQLRCNVRRNLAKHLDPETYGERVMPAGAGGGATVHIYLPGKPQPSADTARVIEGSPAKLEDGREDE